MFLEIFTGEIGVAFHDVHDDGSPCFDIARLRLVKEVEAADDVRA